MKKLLLICTLFLSFSGAKAQGYESIFGSSSTVWNIAIELLDAGYHTNTYSVGDTITFNTHTYKKIRLYNNNTQYSIREDTISGKVWVYDGNTETLISDMELAIGDSIYVGNTAIWGSSGGYAKVDSIYFANNRKHIQLNRSFYYNPLKRVELIEGVGPTTGVLQGATHFGTFNHRLVCAHKDGNLTFADSTLFNPAPCLYNPVGIEEELKKNYISLYPNPANSHLTFALANQSNLPVWLTITDAMGRTIFKEIITAENPRIAVESWANGIYFFRIWTDGKPAASGKFFVAH